MRLEISVYTHMHTVFVTAMHTHCEEDGHGGQFMKTSKLAKPRVLQPDGVPLREFAGED